MKNYNHAALPVGSAQEKANHHRESAPKSEENQAETAAQQSALHSTRGDLRAADGDFSGALNEYKKAAHLDPESPERLTKLAESYAAMDVPHKAVEYYQRALRSQEARGGADLSEAHAGLGDLCRTFALSAAAIRSYTRAVRSRPRHPFYRWKLGVALAALGMFDQAAEQLEMAIQLSPRDAYFRFALAEVYLLMQREEGAVEELENAVNLAPRDDYYRLRLGAALLRLEHTAAAVPHFERAVELQPKNSSYRTLLRYAYARNAQEPTISVDVEMLELGAYDEDFVRRIQVLSQPVVHDRI